MKTEPYFDFGLTVTQAEILRNCMAQALVDTPYEYWTREDKGVWLRLNGFISEHR